MYECPKCPYSILFSALFLQGVASVLGNNFANKNLPKMSHLLRTEYRVN